MRRRYDGRVPDAVAAFEDHESRFDRSPILPPPPAGATVLHDREYRVRAFRLDGEGPDEATVLLQGAVRDQKPDGLMIAGDPDPLTIHHMAIELEVEYPGLTIVAARVAFEAHPHPECVGIVDHYQRLVGMSIARGFNQKVRELFGGPRACTHTTALLGAMAPVAIQTRWSLRSLAHPAGPLAPGEGSARSSESMEQTAVSNLNTCHVWAEDGPAISTIRAGGTFDEPVTLTRRRRELGRRLPPP